MARLKVVLVFTCMLGIGGQACAQTPQATELRGPAYSVKRVLLPDGKVVERLVWPSASAAPAMDVAPQGSEAWLRRMLDPTRNGLALKHPRLFADWLDAVTEPQFMTALATVALTPETYPHLLGRLLDPATVRNWAEFVDPWLYLQWMLAGLDPGFHVNLWTRLADPDKTRRWLNVGHAVASPAHGAAEAPRRTAGDTWLRLPALNPADNPWLAQRGTYRY